MKRKSFRNTRKQYKNILNHQWNHHGDVNKPSFYNERKGKIRHQLGCYPPVFFKVKYPKQLIHYLQRNGCKIETFNYSTEGMGGRFIRQPQQFRYMRKGLRINRGLEFYYKSYLFWLRFDNDELTESYGIINWIAIFDKNKSITDVGYESSTDEKEIPIPKTNAEFINLIESFISKLNC